MTTESTEFRPSSFPCQQCQASPDDQQLVRAPTGWVWRCRRCHSETGRTLPFDPRVAPDGRETAWAAIDTLKIFVPIIAPIENDLIYEIVRPYFVAGWCVRDLLHAVNYLPDGTTHPGQGVAWVRGEDRDRTLWRLRQRLRRWRFSDREEGEDVMNGPYSTTARAMADLGAGQRARAVARDLEWQQRAAAARSAAHSGAREVARRQAKIAASLAREAASRADAAERERLVADITRGREAAEVRRESAD
ncbi:hypothetical protein J2S43_005994 [Catenuloplanes nepalensis]|uniref:Restriction endonuclease n=1 Tax=Catenuloplanes nepalensis TaxID=587533 RepID=A0ABT9N1A6_9ACTN|nr:hypothetical protein [Catenuloplanes nepalensis]MDP9797482.1 hypothetical protein [Catenuloplanes nepalensis]